MEGLHGPLVNSEAIDAVNEGEDIPDVVTVAGEEAFRLLYHSTDAWRGYYEAVAIEGTGWEKVEDGSVTGEWDDAPEGTRPSTVEERINRFTELEAAEGREVVVVVTPTSNVFSMGFDVFRRERRGAVA